MLKVSQAQGPSHSTEAAGALELCVCVFGEHVQGPHSPESDMCPGWDLASVIP